MLPFVHVLLGLIAGIVIMQFLITPALKKHSSDKENKAFKTYSENLASGESDVSTLKNANTELQKQVAELEERSQTTEPEEEIVIPILPEEDAPADGDAPVAANEEAEESAPDDLSAENKKLMDDLCRMKLELQAAQRTVEETKVANT